MVETFLRRFVEYEKRTQAVIILTALTLLVVVWPATDEYSAAASRLRTAKSELEQANQDVEKLPQFMQLFVKTQDQLRQLEGQTVTAPVAQSLRGELVQIARQTGCMMRSIRLNEPSSRVWRENDDPLAGNSRADQGEETPFELVARQLSVSITGPMAGVHQFLSRVHSIDRLIHTKTVSLKRADSEENKAILDLDILLFDLTRKSET